MLLTRLPAGWLLGARPFPAARDCLWAYPLVGALVGGGGGAVFLLAGALSMPPLLAAAWTWAALALLSGALHEDGLADVADGFGGGGTRERKLDIMRDSRIGSYGALALALSLAVRIAALAAVPRPAAALIAAGALSRAAMSLPAALPAARADGLGAAVGSPGRAAAAGAAVALAIALTALPVPAAAAAAAAAVAAGFAVALLALRQIGGFTGDVLGAAAVLAECAVLTVLASGT